MVKGGWKQIYPKDCYRVLLMLSGETGLSFPKVVNIVLREGLIRLDKIPASTSRADLLVERPLIEVKPLTLEQMKEKEENERLNRFYSSVLKDWLSLSDRAKVQHMKNAKKLADNIPNAKLVLALTDGDREEEVKNGFT